MGGRLKRWALVVGAGVMVVHPLRSLAAAGEKPTMEEVRAELSDGDYSVRKHGVKDLQGILARQVVELTTSDDPELSAALEKTAEEQASLIRWTLGVLKGGTAEEKKAVQWALSEAIRPSLTLALSVDEAAQQRGIAFLARQQGAEADVVLASLIADDDAYRSCEAIDAVYERAPSTPVLAALWEITSRGLTPTDYTARTRGFSGAHLSVPGSRPATPSRLSFPAAAALLAKYKDPSTAAALAALVPHLTGASAWSVTGGDDRTEAFCELAAACKSEETLAFVYKLAVGPLSGSTSSANYYHSNRSGMLALFATMIGMKPADFGLQQGLPGWPRMWYSANEMAEGQAMAQVREWWTSRHGGAGNADKGVPAAGAK